MGDCMSAGSPSTETPSAGTPSAETGAAFFDGAARNGRLKELKAVRLCTSGELCASLVAMLDNNPHIEACTLDSHFFEADCPSNTSFEGSAEILAALQRAPALKRASLEIGYGATRIDLSASEWLL